MQGALFFSRYEQVIKWRQDACPRGHLVDIRDYCYLLW